AAAPEAAPVAAPSATVPATGSAKPVATMAEASGSAFAVPPEGRTRPLVAIVEDDPVFARILLDIAEERGFDGLVVPRGRELPSVIRHQAPDAISLDIQLPDVDGWTLVDRITTDREMRHLPVHLISVVDDEERLRGRGIEYSGKPVSRERLIEVFDALRQQATRRDRRLLLVRPRTDAAERVRAALAAIPGLTVDEVTPARAQAAMKGADALLIVAPVPSAPTSALLQSLVNGSDGLPVIAAFDTEPSAEDARLLARMRASVIEPVETGGTGALLDALAAALRLRWSDLPVDLRQTIAASPARDSVLAGQTVAVIDDDIRNIFSMTALLEDHDLKVVSAESGPDGLALLERTPDVAAVLVDIMMPGMDGYEMMRRIRADARLRDLPLIAVTAKAMAEDRERCFEAGASDYLSKPVEKEELIAVLRTWLKRRQPAGGGA
ncbi:MAG TPA: response regulator, partial [Paracoccus sp. (in: a-proteobacteria)]|nr:response regulator [Paracoccus sp. (in: a-proteobacteria)]